MTRDVDAPSRPLPLARPNIGPLERELVLDVLDSDVLSMGPYGREFEERVARFVGRRRGIACSSGTAGLHMLIRGLGIASGDEVITSSFSFVASANCMLYEGAVPRFVDIEEETLGIDPGRAADAIGARTKAILAVDVFGQPCRMDVLEDVAQRANLHLIEDSCEALGSSRQGRASGSFGVASVFAFYPNKQITTGEGGMVVTDNDRLADRLVSMRNQGRDADGTWLRHVQLGYNYRLDEISAALGVAQMRRFEELRAGRERAAAAYEHALGDLNWLTLPRPAAASTVDWFVYVVRLDPSIDRDALILRLAAYGVPARPYFSPIHLQPLYVERFGYEPGAFPVTERVAKSTLALPFSSLLDEHAVERVRQALVASVGRAHA